MNEGQELGDLPEFDERSIRRSMRRGVGRTVATTVLILLLGTAILDGTTQRIANERSQRFSKVYGHAYKAVNAGYSIHTSPTERPFHPGPALTLGATLHTPGGENGRPQITGHIWADIRGRILPVSKEGRTVLSPTPVSERLTDDPPKEATRSLLSKLSVPVEALGIVNFKNGLDESTLRNLRAKHGICYTGPETGFEFFQREFRGEAEERRCQPKGAFLAAILLEPPSIHVERTGVCNLVPYQRLSWPTPYVAHLSSWAGLLRESDRANLEELGLPAAACLTKLAKQGLSYGMVIYRASLEDISALLDEELVQSVAVVDVEFDLGG